MRLFAEAEQARIERTVSARTSATGRTAFFKGFGADTCLSWR